MVIRESCSGGALQPSLQQAPSYYALSAPELHGRALEDDCVADVCVVGGGYTGLSTALHLARRGLDVRLLEQSQIGWGASGRNGGQVHVGMRREQPWLEAQMGKEDARALWRLALDARDYLDELLATHEIECELRLGLLYADHKPRYTAATRRHVDFMRTRYAYSALRFVDRTELREMLAGDAYCSGALDSRGGHLHPLKYARGLARAAQSSGAQLYENSEVISVRRDASRWRVQTRTAAVLARYVVLACNGYLRGLAPKVASRVLPINNFIATTRVLGADGARALIRDGIAVSDSRFVVNYFRITADHRLLFGGGESYGYRFPRDIQGFVRPHLLKVFPQLAREPLEFAWGGTLAITPTRMPYVCELEAGFYNASGFSGLGVVLAPYVGKILADAMTGERAEFDLLARVPVPRFPGGRALRRPTLIAAMLWYALRDRL